MQKKPNFFFFFPHEDHLTMPAQSVAYLTGVDLHYKYLGSTVPTFLRTTPQCAKDRTSPFLKPETSPSRGK